MESSESIQDIRRALSDLAVELRSHSAGCENGTFLHKASHVLQEAQRLLNVLENTSKDASQSPEMTGQKTNGEKDADCTEIARLKNESMLSLLENSANAVYMKNLLTDKYEYMSPAIEQTTGITLSEIASMDLSQVMERIHPDDQATVRAALNRVTAGSKEVIEYRFKDKDGRYRMLSDSIHTHFNQQGKPLCLIGIVRDVSTQKLLEQSICESEERFRLLAESIEFVFWFMNLEQGKMVYINPAFERIWGIPTNAIYANAKIWIDSIHPEDRSRVLQELDQWYSGSKEEYDVEYRIVRADGGIRWIWDRGTVIGRQLGKPSRVCGIATDISERKRAERDLRHANERLELSQHAAGAGVWDWDMARGRLEWSRELFELFGLDPEKDCAEFETWLRVMHPDDRSAASARIDNAVSDGSILDSEYRILLKDGTVRWINALGRTMYNPEGKPLRMLGICFDVTRRRRMEESLRQSEDRYRSLVELSPDALFINLNDRIVFVNQAAVGLLGASSVNELVGRNPFDFRLPEYHAIFRERNERCLAGETTPLIEGKILKLDGSIVDVEEAAATFTMEEGSAIQVIMRDITERKRTEKSLSIAKLQAEAANLAKSEFLANMSHEIRNPMNGIMIAVQLMEDSELTNEQRECLNSIKVCSNGLLLLINDILDLSKVESGKIELEQKDFSLRTSIHEVIRTQISLIHGKGLRMQTEIPEEVPDSLTGDQLRLKQVLLNLLGNAVKFTEKGSIGISVAVSDRHDDIALLQIGVTDSGIGINPKVMHKIFAPFIQADTSTTRKYGGTGLGLSICHRLVELMGGKIWAESREGIGSTFFIQVPFIVNKTEVEFNNRTIVETVQPLWDDSPLKILLVEDMEINLALISRLLQRRGHTVVEAHDGMEALRIWEVEAFDAILMDIHMPGMSGIEVAKTIRAREQETGKHIPTIAITGRAFQEEREKILSQGFDGYIPKPIEISALFQELRRCLQNRTQ
ncbi:MAG: PAS domain S-box protein [Deltaproteobacteria bacterium]|nr:PAS domain S-box protein [Deltaproteobacteria bacterium]